MRISELLSKSIILEGGNIFKDKNGKITTKNIKKDEIIPTVKILEKILKTPLVDNILGSAGKKVMSGDIDILIDSNTMTKENIFSKLSSWVINKGDDPRDWIRKVGISVSFKMPILGNSKNGFVQVDLMSDSDPKWMKFSMASAGDASKYSGAERNMIMSSIAKSQGLKYSWQKGLIKREDDSPISKDPEIIAKRLLGPKQTSKVFDSVESIQLALSGNSRALNDLRNLQDSLLDIDLNGKQKSNTQIRTDKEESNRIAKILKDL